MAIAIAAAITGIDVHTYLVKDVNRAKKFYRDVLGLPVLNENESGAEYELSDGSTFGVYKMADGSWHAGSGVMFAVPDIDEAIQTYRKRGAKIQKQIFNSPNCRLAVGEDSEGNMFLLHQRKERVS
jgi:predicted enzyme related to lactoylglutathione lyase